MRHSVFQIEGSSVEETLQWAKDVAKLDIDHLRSCLIRCGEFCELCLSLAEYYEQNLSDTHKLIEEGKGDPVVNEKRLTLLEIGDRTNNLVGYLTLLQMDAMLSLIHMMEAKSDAERLVTCKHAYTIIHDARIKGIFNVISREMGNLPEEVLSGHERKGLWKEIKEVVRNMISEEEAEKVRNTIDAHKEASFSRQIAAYRICDFTRCFASLYALTELSWILQQAMSIVRRNIDKLENVFVEEVKDRIAKWDSLLKEFENQSFSNDTCHEIVSAKRF